MPYLKHCSRYRRIKIKFAINNSKHQIVFHVNNFVNGINSFKWLYKNVQIDAVIYFINDTAISMLFVTEIINEVLN